MQEGYWHSKYLNVYLYFQLEYYKDNMTDKSEIMLYVCFASFIQDSVSNLIEKYNFVSPLKMWRFTENIKLY